LNKTLDRSLLTLGVVCPIRHLPLELIIQVNSKRMPNLNEVWILKLFRRYFNCM